MAPSWFQILIVVLLMVLLFGRGKISDLMGDLAKGIKSFKTGLAEDEEKPAPKRVEEDRTATRIDASIRDQEDALAR